VTILLTREHFGKKSLIDKNGKPYHPRGFGGHADHYAGFTIQYEIYSRIFEDFIFLKHNNDSDLVHQIREENLNYEDIITRVMKDFTGNMFGEFEHYLVVYAPKIENELVILYEVSKIEMVVANVSQVNVKYSDQCLLMKNKFTESSTTY